MLKITQFQKNKCVASNARKTMPNIILVTIDSLRPDYLGCYQGVKNNAPLTPNIDTLAEKGVIFDHAISQGGVTQTSFPAMLSGQYMCRYMDAYTGISDKRVLISEILKELNYFTCAFNSNPYISTQLGYNRGFDYFYDNLPRISNKGLPERIMIEYTKLKTLLKGPYHPADKLNSKAIPLLKRKQQPYFFWIHYMDVHGPYVSKKGLTISNRIKASILWNKSNHDLKALSKKQKAILKKTYEEEVQYFDVYFGKLLKHIDLENTMIILTADHGELLGEKNLFSHPPRNLYDELLRVPLIIYYPAKIAPHRVKQNVKLLDIVPTIVDFLEINTDIKFDGESLLPFSGLTDSKYSGKYIISEVWTKIIAIRDHQWKLIANYLDNDMQLYDLVNDKNETTNLADTHPDIVKKMEGIIKEHLININAPLKELTDCRFEYDEAVKVQLKGLGYL